MNKVLCRIGIHGVITDTDFGNDRLRSLERWDHYEEMRQSLNMYIGASWIGCYFWYSKKPVPNVHPVYQLHMLVSIACMQCTDAAYCHICCKYVCVSVCLCLCVRHTGELCKKRLNWSRRRFEGWLIWVQGSMYCIGVQISPREGALLRGTCIDHCNVPSHECTPHSQANVFAKCTNGWQNGDAAVC